MKRYIRAHFRDPKDEWDHLYVDMILNDDGSLWRGLPLCGWWGALKSTDIMPFVIKLGVDDEYLIDFGSDDETDQTTRLQKIELPSDRVRVGSKLRFKYDDESVLLQAAQLVDMFSGELLDNG